MTWPEYQTMLQWGMLQIVEAKLKPASAAEAVQQKFGVTISPDTLRMAAKKVQQGQAH